MTRPSAVRRSRLLAALRRVEELIAVTLALAMVGLGGLQIALRNLGAANLPWGDPLLRVMVLWIAMIGAVLATRAGRHIRIDILSHLLPPRVERMRQAVTSAFAALVCAVLSLHGARFVALEYELGSPGFGPVPAWVGALAIPLGFGVMALRFATAVMVPPPGGR